MIVVGSSLIARAAGYGDMHDDRYTYPMTHWFMMGANRETTGGYYAEDDLFYAFSSFFMRSVKNKRPLGLLSGFVWMAYQAI